MYSVSRARYISEGSFYSPIESLLYSVTEQVTFNINEDTSDDSKSKASGDGNPISNFFKKIGDWFKKIWEKIKGWFKKKEDKSNPNTRLAANAPIKFKDYSKNITDTTTILVGAIQGFVKKLNALSLTKGDFTSISKSLSDFSNDAADCLGNLPDQAGTKNAAANEAASLKAEISKAITAMSGGANDVVTTDIETALTNAQTKIEANAQAQTEPNEENKTAGEGREICRTVDAQLIEYDKNLDALAGSVKTTTDKIAESISESMIYNYGSYRAFYETVDDNGKKVINAYGTIITKILTLIHTCVLKTAQTACTNFNTMSKACGYDKGIFPVYQMDTAETKSK